MKSIHILLCIYLVCSATIISCKKENTPSTGLVADAVIIEKLSASFVQPGDEVTLYGSHLVQKDLVTEVFITGRPSEVLHLSADSITIKVPSKVQTGKVMVTLSKGALFTSVYGPAIEVKPTPLIKSFAPLYAYGGDTIELRTENFSDVESNNAIYLGSKKLQILSRKGRDTIVVKLPADAATGFFSWHTYNGPSFKMETLFPVRQTSYAANTVAHWFYNDPGFSYMDTLVRGYPDLAGYNYESTHKPVYDAALQYINSTDRKYTIFLPSDAAYHKTNISRTDFVNMIKSKPYNYNVLLANAIVPGQNMRLATMQDGDKEKTVYTMKLAFWDYPVEVDDYNFVKIVIEDGVKYAQVWGPYDQSAPMVKLLGEHQVGNATIIETEGELGVIYY
jgi:hypothetical protein